MSAASRVLYQGTTDRDAASRFAAAIASSSSTSAMADSRQTRWTAEQEILQRSFERVHVHRNDLLQLPYPTPPVTAPLPPPSAVPIHRVYTLRCATCDTFLSDRGMRVSRRHLFRKIRRGALNAAGSKNLPRPSRP